MTRKGKGKEGEVRRPYISFQIESEYRDRLDEIIVALPKTLAANRSKALAAILMAYLAANPAPSDVEKTKLLILKMRRGELKLAENG